MQQFWLAHEAVAKLRHEAVTSEIRSVRSDVQLMLERLDEAERSSSALTSSPMAPIWIQQGQTGIWIGPTDPAVHPPTAATGAPVPQPDPGTRTPAFGTGVEVRSASVSPAPAPAPAPASVPFQAPPVRPARSALPGQIVLDPQAPPSAYRMLRGSDSVFQLWTEWTLGLAGGPSIEALDRCWGPRWRTGSGEAMFYSRRRKIINEVRRRVEAGTARDERQAVDQLEQLRGTRSLDWLRKNGLNGR